MNIIEQRYYGDVNRIANQMKEISQGLKEIVALLQTSTDVATTKEKETEHGSND